MPPSNMNPATPETPAPAPAEQPAPTQPEVTPADSGVDPASVEAARGMVDQAVGSMPAPEAPQQPTELSATPAPSTPEAPAAAPATPSTETNRLMDAAAEAVRQASAASVQQNAPGNPENYIGLPPQNSTEATQAAPSTETPSAPEQITPPPAA
ncbi:MAG TPA: hypothetical protein QF549_01475 [Candidatus Saccharimonadaceae bacterium]|nr:hypothetical protein [Candidatus Saccharimonadaceae bacterium]